MTEAIITVRTLPIATVESIDEKTVTLRLPDGWTPRSVRLRVGETFNVDLTVTAPFVTGHTNNSETVDSLLKEIARRISP